MDERIKRNLIDSYQEDGGFMVHSCATLEKIFAAYGIDPRISTDRKILDIEGLTHFFQHGVLGLFKKLSITADDRVLSPGEGNGAPSRLLAKRAHCAITGIDINPDQVEKARTCAVLHGVEDLVDYHLANVETLDLNRNDFTKAYCNETTCHWQDKQSAFARINRHLQPGALIGINEWLRGDRGSLNEAWKEMPEFRTYYCEDIWFQHSLDDYCQLLEAAGFRIIHASECTDRCDGRMRAQLMQLKMDNNPYIRIVGPGVQKRGIGYYSTMLATHYTYLRYGVLVAEKK